MATSRYARVSIAFPAALANRAVGGNVTHHTRSTGADLLNKGVGNTFALVGLTKRDS
jgi:hypothetical protein